MQVFSFRLSSMSVEQCRLHLVPPFAKKTNIHWDDQDMSGPLPCQQLVDHYQAFYPMMDDNERQPQPESHQVSRKRRCQPIMDPQQRKNLPLPPLPTVENFLTIMDEPNSPASSYFSARSHSSVSSNSTLNSLLLDDITDQLAKTHLIEPTFLFENNAILDKEQTADCLLSLPPPVPPKDAHLAKRKETKAIMQSISHYPHETSSHKKRRVTETTTNSGFFHKQSKQRPPIPPRRSSMPLPLPPKETEIPSMPLNAKKNAQYYRQKPSKPVFLDER
ncbi:uncharacterized protein B0P05DRAFT_213338 [Gilbertella persicaria]|uniref:uncharacterized protein n=1 Tax=Gilbertella persicaria TaxID=101096 RepID=UPI00221E7FD6|nr:uncharacterized protein B0P05DRAFT_213338 [Gilbertella persicaria]KAI8065323.1 hypothetical protein B0P05DRAFT_213338 [Gilbertella persicaria]